MFLRAVVPGIFSSFPLSTAVFLLTAFFLEAVPTHLIELVMEYGLSNELLSYLYGGKFTAFVQYPCPTVNCLTVKLMPIHIGVMGFITIGVALGWYFTSEVKRFNDLFNLPVEESEPERKYRYAGGIFLFVFFQAFVHLLIYGVNMYYEDYVWSLGVLFSHLFDGVRIYFIPLHLASGAFFGYFAVKTGLRLEEERLREEARRKMVERSDTPMFVVRNNNVDYANEAFRRLLGGGFSANFEDIKSALPEHRLEERFAGVFVGKIGAEAREKISLQSATLGDLLKSASFLVLIGSLALGGLLYAAGFLDPSYGTRGTLYVGNELSDISVVDVATGKEMYKLPAGDHVSAIAVSEDRRYLFATMIGHHLVGPSPLCQCINQLAVKELRANSVWVYDLKERKVVTNIPTRGYPADVEIAGDYLLVPNAGEDTMLVMNASSYKLVKFIKVGNNPSSIAVAGDYAYVANSELRSESGSVSVVDLKSLEEVSRIPLQSNPVDIAVLKNVAYVSASNAVYVLSIEKRRVDEVIKTEGKLTKLALAPDRVYAADALEKSVRVLGTQEKIALGVEPKDIAVTSDGRLLYAATEKGVFIIHTASNTVLKKIPITRLPASLRLQPAPSS